MHKITITKKSFDKVLSCKGQDPPKENFEENEIIFWDICKNLPDVVIWDCYSRLGDISDVSIDQVQGIYEEGTIKKGHLREPKTVVNLFKNFAGAAKFIRNLERTVIITTASNISDNGQADVTLKLSNFKNINYRNGLKMNSEFLYYNQPFVWPCYGSGFLLDDDIMLTAGHVLSIDNIFGWGEYSEKEMEKKLDNIRIIRDFHMDLITGSTAKIPKANIYKLTSTACEDIAKNINNKKDYDKRYNHNSEDWAWVRVEPINNGTGGLAAPSVDERIFSIQPRLTFNNQNILGNKVYCVGHPLGLPIKASYSGMITSGKVTNELFTCRLNTLAGNSGSPVFDAHTHELIGIISGNEGFSDLLSEDNMTLIPTFFMNNFNGATVSRIHVSLESLLDSKLYR